MCALAERKRLLCDWIEERLLFDAVPLAVLDVVDDSLLEDPISLTVEFQNNSADPADVGYGPYFDLHAAAGVDVNLASAGLLNLDVNIQLAGEFNSTGNLIAVGSGDPGQPIDHPLLGVPIAGGTPGDRLYVVEVPLHSVVPGQPSIAIDLEAKLSALAGAIAGTPLDFRVQAGFRYGTDPLDNPATDAPLLGAAIPHAITPLVARLTKTVDLLEDETVSGPNFPVSFTLAIDIAEGESLTNLLIIDQLPANLEYLPGSLTLTAGGNVLDTPVTPGPQLAGDNDLIVRFDSFLGTAALDDITITYEAFVPELDAAGAAVLDPASGVPVQLVTEASLTADHAAGSLAIGADATPGVFENDGTDYAFVALAVAIQKEVQIAVDLNASGATPGDILEYTINFQVSDYFSIDDVVLDDSLQDGLRFEPLSLPVLNVFENGVASSGAFNAFNFGAVLNSPAGDGSTDLQLRVSDELTSRLLGGVLDGDLASDGSLTGGTSGTLTYRGIMQELFTDLIPPGGVNLGVNDTLVNTASITAELASAAVVSEFSSASVTVPSITVSKSIYAIDGNAPLGLPAVRPQQVITFRLQADLITGDAANLILSDFLPLPLFSASELTTLSAIPSVVAPLAGFASYGPTHTLHLVAPNSHPPILTVDPVANRIDLDFGSFDSTLSLAGTVDILFTLTVQDQPYAVGSLLANQLSASYDNAAGTSFAAAAFSGFELDIPDLNVAKGVVSTTSADAVFSLSSLGPVAFLDAGLDLLGGPAFLSTFTSSELALDPIDADVSNVDAGDLVKFAITIENTGGADAFDVLIRDTLPAGFQLPSGPLGINLDVRSGLGLPILYTTPVGGIASPTDLFGAGIRLVDAALEGAVNAADDAALLGNGSNIIVLSYDLAVAAAAELGTTITNTVHLDEYAAVDAGIDLTLGTEVASDDDSSATTDRPALNSLSLGTSVNSPNNSSSQAAIGEAVQYQLTLTLPAGTLPNSVLIDALDLGLSFVSLDSLQAFSGGVPTNDVTSSRGDFSQTALFAPSAAGDGVNAAQSLNFDLGTIVNTNSDDEAIETLVLTYTARVANAATNQGEAGGTQLANNARFEWGALLTQQTAPSGAANIEVIEPELAISRTLASQTGTAFDRATYTISISHSGASQTDAFDVTFDELLPSELAVVFASDVTALHSSDGDITSLFEFAAGTLRTQAGQGFDLQLGESLTVIVDAALGAELMPGQLVDSGSIVRWTSRSGAAGGERTGAGSGTNDYIAAAADTNAVILQPVMRDFRLLGTSIAGGLNAADQVVIGETAQLEASFYVPAGLANSVQLITELDLGLEFISLDSIASFTAGVASGDVTSSRGPLAATNLFQPVLSGDGGSFAQTLNLSLGDLTNGNSEDAESEWIAVTWTVRAVNSATNQGEPPATQLGGNTHVSFDIGAGLTASAARAVDVRLEVIEPRLQASSTVEVNPPSGSSSGDAGDSVTWITVISHAADTGADAFDVTLSNPLPDELTYSYPADVTVLHSMLGDVTDRFEVITNRLATKAGQPVDLLDGETLTATINATLVGSVQPGAAYGEQAEARWTSLPGPVAAERTGDGGGGGVNDYRVSTNPAVIAIDTPQITANAVLGGDLDGPSNGLTELAIGETAQVRVTIALPEGQLSAARLVDQLDTGLAFVSLDAIEVYSSGAPTAAVASSIDSFANLASFAPAVVGDGNSTPQLLSFDFGTLTNANNDNGAMETAVVTYSVRAVNSAGNQGEGSGTLLGATALVSWDLHGVTQQTPAVGRPALAVIEPDLLIAKSASDTTPHLGDRVAMTLQVDHSGPSDTDAFDLRLLDAIPAGVVLDVASVVVAGAVIASGDPQFGESTPGALDLTLDRLQHGQTLTVQYDLVISSDPSHFGGTLSSDAGLTWTSVAGAAALERTGADPGGVDDYRISAGEPLTVVGADLALENGNGADQLSAGQQVTYELSVANGGSDAATGVVVSAAVPVDRLQFDFTDDPANTVFDSGSGSLVWTPGSLAAGATRTLEVTATVRNPVPAGVEFVSIAATVSHDDIDPTPADNEASDSDPLEAGVDHSVSRTNDSAGTVQPGESFSYLITATNSGDQDATGVNVTQVLDLAILNAATITTSEPADVSFDSASGQLVWNVGALAGGGGTAVLSISVTVRDQVPAGVDDFTDTVVVSDDGNHGADPMPADNQAAPESIVLAAAPDYELTQTNDLPDNTAVPGQSYGYQLAVANSGNQGGGGVFVSVDLPVELLDAATIISSDPAAFSLDSGSGTATWTVGDLAPGSAAGLTIDVTVRESIPAGADAIAVTAVADDDRANGDDPTPGNNSSAVPPVELDAVPDYSIEITDNAPGGSVQPGAQFSYQIRARNDGNQGGTGVTVAGTLRPAVFDLGAVTTDQPGSAALDSVSGGLTWDVGSLAVGEESVLTVNVQVRAQLPAGEHDIGTTVMITDDSTNGDDPALGNNSATSAVILLDAAPDYSLVRSTDLSDPLEAGDQLSLTFSVTNKGNQDGTGVQFLHQIPLDVFDPASVSSDDPANVTFDAGSGELVWNAGALAAGSTTQLTVTLTARDPAPAGVETIQDPAIVADDTLNGPDPTPGDNAPPPLFIEIDAVPDYSITRTTTLPDPAVPGQAFHHVITVTNNGNQDGTGILVVNAFPLNAIDPAAVVTDDPDGTAFDPATGELVWTLDALAGGGSTATLVVSMNLRDPIPAGLETFSDSVVGSDDGRGGEDPTPADNAADPIAINVEAAPDYSVQRTSDTSGPVVPGQIIRYTIDVENNGDQDGEGVLVTHHLPFDIIDPSSIVSTGPGETTIDAANGEVRWLVDDLAGNGGRESLNLTVRVRDPLPAGADDFDEHVTVSDNGSGGSDPNPSNNTTSSETVVINAAPDYAISRALLTPSPVPAGSPFEYRLTVSNQGNQGGTGVVVTDTVPLELLFADSVAINDDANVDFEAAGGGMVWHVGNLPAGATKTLTIRGNLRLLLHDHPGRFFSAAAVADDGLNGVDTNLANNVTTATLASESFVLDPLFTQVAFPTADDDDDDDNDDDLASLLDALEPSSGAVPPAGGATVVRRIHAASGALVSEKAVLNTDDTPSDDRWLVPFSQVVISASRHEVLIDQTVTPNGVGDASGVNVYRQVLSNIEGMRFYSEQPIPQSVIRTAPGNWQQHFHDLNKSSVGLDSAAPSVSRHELLAF